MMKKYKFLYLLISSAIFTGCGNLSDDPDGDYQVYLQWETPLFYKDPLTEKDLTGYRIYYGRSEEKLRLLDEVRDTQQTSYYVSGLNSGTYYFSVTALDSGNLESDPTTLAMVNITH